MLALWFWWGRTVAAANNRRRAAEIHGRRSETLAAFALACKLCRVIGRRVKTPAGEIDLVAIAPSGLLCFIEVKARRTERDAVEAISDRQRDRIARAAELFLRSQPALRHKAVRFDTMLIIPRRWPRHVRDAWRPGF
jgi:putative endonuclease